MFPITINESEKDWQVGPYEGVELKILRKDEATGGVTVLRKFHAGVTVPAHIHPEANETAYVLSGEWEAREWAHSPGYFASVQANCFHSRRAYLHAPAHAAAPICTRPPMR